MTVPLAGLQAIKYKDRGHWAEGNLDLMRAAEGQHWTFQGTVLEREGDRSSSKLSSIAAWSFTPSVVLDPGKNAVERAPGLEDALENPKKAFVELYKKMMGEKILAWLGTDGKTVIQLIAPDWKKVPRNCWTPISGGKGARWPRTRGSKKRGRNCLRTRPSTRRWTRCSTAR